MKQRAKVRYGGGGAVDQRERLITAARIALGEIGSGASVEDIARWAGIDPAVLHHHFPDRDDLVSAVINDLVASIRDDEDRTAVTDAPAGALLPVFSTRPRALSPKYAVAPVAAIAALMPMGAMPTATAATTAVSEPAAVEPAPAQVLTLSPLWPVWSLRSALGGSLCPPDTCVSLPYMPFWTPGGVDMLTARLAATTDIGAALGTDTVVFGYSHGALVASRWLAEHADDVGAPSPDELSFVLIGNPARAHGGIMPAMPSTQYQVIDIVRQYDPVADSPDNPFNLLALLNVAAGILSPVHLDYTGVDIDDPANIVWTEGNITYVFVPTQNLPLLAPLRLIGLSWLADALDQPVREIIEQAYDRPYLPAAEPELPPAETVSMPSVSTFSDTADLAAAPDEPAVTVEDARTRTDQEPDIEVAASLDDPAEAAREADAEDPAESPSEAPVEASDPASPNETESDEETAPAEESANTPDADDTDNTDAE